MNASVIKFLGFEQVFKTASPACPWAAARGGSDFDPKGPFGRGNYALLPKLYDRAFKHIGQFTDVPAGDIGVGAREIGYLFGQYKRLRNEVTGVLTGKGLSYGGSLVRPEATGYGLCYFTQEALRCMKQDSFEGKTVVVSGSGNVAIYATEKATQLGGKVVALSDSNGYIYDKNGVNLDVVKAIKLQRRGRISEYVKEVPGAEYHEGCAGIWGIRAILRCPAPRRTKLTAKAPRSWRQMAAKWCARAPICLYARGHCRV